MYGNIVEFVPLKYDAELSRPCSTRLDEKSSSAAIIPQAAYETAISSLFQYTLSKYIATKLVNPSKSPNSALRLGIGHTSLLVAAIIGLRSIVTVHLELSLEIECGAACHETMRVCLNISKSNPLPKVCFNVSWLISDIPSYLYSNAVSSLIGLGYYEYYKCWIVVTQTQSEYPFISLQYPL